MKKFIIILLSIYSILFLSGCSLKEEAAPGSQEEFNPGDIDFQNLTASQTKRVYIVSYLNRSRNLNKLAELTYDDVDSLITLLNQVELTGEPSEEFQEVTGMYWEMYRIELENGQEFDFAADNHCYVIDSMGYDADEETGYKIFKQYHEWSEKYFPEDYSSDK